MIYSLTDVFKSPDLVLLTVSAVYTRGVDQWYSVNGAVKSFPKVIKSLDLLLLTVCADCASGVDQQYSEHGVCGVIYSLTEVVKRLQPVILTLYAF